MVNCSLCKCTKTKTTSELSITFHRFPTDPELQEKWILAINRVNFKPTKFSFLCSKHFQKTDLITTVGRTRLKKHAVPTNFEFSQRAKREYFPKSEGHSEHVEFNHITENYSLNTPSSTSTVAIENSPRKKIVRRPRKLAIYFGDFKEADLEYPKKAKLMWQMAKVTIKSKNNKLNNLRRKNKRLGNKINVLKGLIERLKISNENSDDCISLLDDFKSEPESPQLLVEDRDPLSSTNEPPIPKKRPRPETVLTSRVSSSAPEDVFDAIGKNVAHKLRGMIQQQRIIAEKIISDAMYHGQMETLTVDSHLALNKDSS